MSPIGWGSKADLEAVIDGLHERESELVTALDNIADLLKGHTATTITDPIIEAVNEWTDVR